MADYELFQIEITKNYGVSEWRDDLRKLLRRAGFDGVPVVFLFGDHQIKVGKIFIFFMSFLRVIFILQEESFLEDINMILNTGDIPNLYDHDDRLAIIERVRKNY